MVATAALHTAGLSLVKSYVSNYLIILMKK